MANARATKRINDRLAHHREGLGTARMSFDYYHESIRKELRDPHSLPALYTMGTAAHSLGRMYGQLGILGLLDPPGAAAGAAALGIPRGDPWADVAAAIDCHAWAVRIELETFCTRYAPDRARFTYSVTRRLSLATLLLAHFVAVGDGRRERDTWELLAKPLAAATDDRIHEWWHASRFEPAFVSVYAAARGLKFPLDLPGGDLDALGVYGPLLTHWDDDRWFAAALDKACDYHLKQMFGLSETYESEFDEPPLDLIPAEVFAFEKLRAGVRVAPPTHPLVTCIGPARVMPARPEVLELLDAVHDAYRSFYRA